VKDKYGFYSYVEESNNYLYLTDDQENDENIDKIYYSDNMISLEIKDNDYIFESIIFDDYERIYKELLNEDYDTIQERLSELNINIQVFFLEQSLLNEYNGENTEEDNIIIDIYKDKIHDVKEPVSMIDQAVELSKKDPRGRPPSLVKKTNKENLVKRDDIKVVFDTDTDDVIFHTLYIEDYRLGHKRHGETERYYKAQGRYRLFKPSEGYWRDLNIFEYEAYSRLIGHERKEKVQKIKKEIPISGFVSGGKFKILDALKEKGKKDVRGESKGFVCVENQPIQTTFFYAWYFGLDLNELRKRARPITSRETLDDIMTDNFVRSMKLTDDNGKQRFKEDLSDDELEYYYELYLIAKRGQGYGGITKDVLCNEIKKLMIEQDAFDFERT